MQTHGDDFQDINCIHSDQLQIRGYAKLTGNNAHNRSSSKSRVPVYNCNMVVKATKDSPLRSYDPEKDSHMLDSHFYQFPAFRSRKTSGDKKGKQISESIDQGSTIDKIMALLEKKVASGFHGVEQRFSDENFMLPRKKFKSLLTDLIGHVSKEHYTSILERLKVGSNDTISFDEFISNFKENKTVKLLWKNEAKRQLMEEDAKKLPADRLKDAQRASSKNISDYSPKHKMEIMSASQVICYFRTMAKQNPSKVKALFPRSGSDGKGIIVKTHMSKVISELGIDMFFEEYEKFWNRFDFARTGLVQSQRFFRMIGLSEDNGHKKGLDEDSKTTGRASKRVPVTSRRSSTPTKSPPNEQSTKKENKIAKSVLTESSDLDIKMFLTHKFREGEQCLLNGWKNISPSKNELMTKAELRSFLERFRIYLTPSETESFLLRYRVREEPFNFALFLSKFTQMSKSKLSSKCNSAGFPRGLSPRGSLSTINRAEDLLLDVIHKQYVTFARELGCIESSSGGCLMLQDFVKLMNSLYNTQLSVAAARRCLSKYNLVKDMTVDWPRLLELCTGLRSSFSGSNINHKPPERKVSFNASISHEDSSRSPCQCKRSQSPIKSRTGSELEQTPSHTQDDAQEQRSRSSATLLQEMRCICLQSFNRIGRVTDRLQLDKYGFLTRDKLLVLFNHFGLRLSLTEADIIWNLLPLSLKRQDGTINVFELVQFFTAFRGKGEFMPSSPVADTGTKIDDKESGYEHKKTEEYQASMTEECQVSDGTLNGRRSSLLADHTQSWADGRRSTARSLSPYKDENHTRSASTTDLHQNLIAHETSQSRIVHRVSSREDQRSSRPIPEQLHRTLIENLWAIQKKLQEVDREGLGCTDLDSFKDIFNSLRIELPEEAYEYIQKAFNSSINPGLIDYLQLLHGVKKLGSHQSIPGQLTDSKVKTRPSTCGAQSTPYSDVIRKLRRKLIGRWKSLRRAFRKADIDRDGFICQAEFKEVLKSFGVYLNEDELYFIFSAFDENMDNKISYNEFTSCSFEA